MSKATVTKVEIRYIPDNRLGEAFGKAMIGAREGFLPPAELELQDMPGFQHERRSANHPKNLETIYRHYQRIDDTDDERAAQLNIRSMSYGDAIIIDKTAYYVAADGFVRIADDGSITAVTAD